MINCSISLSSVYPSTATFNATVYSQYLTQNEASFVCFDGSNVQPADLKDPTPVSCQGGYDVWFHSNSPSPNVIDGAIVGDPDENDVTKIQDLISNSVNLPLLLLHRSSEFLLACNQYQLPSENQRAHNMKMITGRRPITFYRDHKPILVYGSDLKTDLSTAVKGLTNNEDLYDEFGSSLKDSSNQSQFVANGSNGSSDGNTTNMIDQSMPKVE
ncbi:hypothetical protein FEM48_Zijuj06G0205500 [Ziziphus jujuba var. spinosa]|uniref:Uncharacterized protein n=1 Tax=Ziziphus jujuba var. spinosa TaxID=714518 RepID=A0A978VBG8_ZIZJJ|nr:hypothetical protein FEM48_Zijuj06G0205500 [Ziziphus jujuba var. spinosa]